MAASLRKCALCSAALRNMFSSVLVVLYLPSVLAWSIQLLAYAMPSVPVPPIILLTDMGPRCRLLAAHGPMPCLSVRTQPLTATGAPSQTSTIPYLSGPGEFAVQFSSGGIHVFWFDIPARATHDAREYSAWAFLGITFFLRSYYIQRMKKYQGDPCPFTPSRAVASP